MLANYIFNKYKDEFFLTNTDPASLGFVLKKQSNCADYVSLLTGTLTEDQEFSFPYLQDGDYQLVLTRGSETKTITFGFYLRLQKSLINNISKALCGETCGCLDCDEVSLDEANAYQGLFNQLIAYQQFIRPYTQDYCDANCAFDKYIHDAMNANKCVLTSEITNQLSTQLITGKTASSRKILFYIAAIYYTAFYFYEHLIAVDEEEETYVDTKFKWIKVQICIRKLGINISDLGELFVEASTECNVAPTVGDVVKSFSDEDYSNDLRTYTFLEADFTNNFFDANGDEPNMVKLLNNAFRGVLYYDGQVINGEGFTFNIDNVGLLQFKFTIQETTAQFDRFYFQINDTNATPKYSNMGKITFAVTQYVNQPPNEVGDNSFTLANRALKVFTLADFTSTTTPAYHDPEGDAVQNLRIDSLPAAGTLLLVNTPCTVGQIIPASSISAGQFKYQAPNQNNSASTDWDFSLSDVGSGQFSS